MMFYRLAVELHALLIALVSPFHPKAKALHQGRKASWRAIRLLPDKIQPEGLWLHASSVGEFEQARPLIDRLKSENPELPITVTFFSPSGYRLRSNYPQSDQVFYLPKDSPHRMAVYFQKINPRALVLVKYDFWLQLFAEARKRQVPAFLVSAVFRPPQPFFKPWGGAYRQLLRGLAGIFVQDPDSQRLLKDLGIESAVAGDSRFDQVMRIQEKARRIAEIETFAEGKKLLVVGSAWLEDLALLQSCWQDLPKDYQVVVAPHEVGEASLKASEALLPKDCQRFSQFQPENSSCFLLIDNIGMLSSIYAYGQIAYVGGGLKTGLHNTLEPAVFGLPVLFGGPRPVKFLEAQGLLDCGGAKNFTDSAELKNFFQQLWTSPDLLATMGQAASHYVESSAGATDIFYPTIGKALKQ